jgi:hypothetical protein
MDDRKLINLKKIKHDETRHAWSLALCRGLPSAFSGRVFLFPDSNFLHPTFRALLIHAPMQSCNHAFFLVFGLVSCFSLINL